MRVTYLLFIGLPALIIFTITGRGSKFLEAIFKRIRLASAKGIRKVMQSAPEANHD